MVFEYCESKESDVVFQKYFALASERSYGKKNWADEYVSL